MTGKFRRLYFATLWVIVGVAIGWSLPRSAVRPGPVSLGPPVAAVATTSSVLIDYGDGLMVTYLDLPVAAGQTVWELLQELEERGVTVQAKDYGGDLGMLVTGFGSVTNDARAGKFWHYWVNQRFATVGVSAYRLEPGDQVFWKYVSDQFRAETQ